MTVVGESDYDVEIKCTWFAGAKNEFAFFPPDALVHVPDDAEGKQK